MTTTKKILWVSWLLFCLLIVLKIFGLDTGEAVTITGGIVTAVVTGFYMWKSKCENREKIALGMVDSLADKYGIENIISLISEILRD